MAVKQTTAGPDELWPVVLGHGPKLRIRNGRVYVRISSTDDSYPIGREPNHAAAFATYTSTITAKSKDALTMAGRHVTGWLLLDGEGDLLGRLASDDEIVYDPAQVAAFAARAGLRVEDWGEVPDTTIDRMIAEPKGGLQPRPLGATRREWLMFVAVVGGILITWPFESQLTYATERTHSLVIFALGVSGFLVGALGLWAGRGLSRLPDRLVTVLGWTLALALAVLSVVTARAGWHIWRLASTQSAAVVAGAAVLCAVIPFWARVQRLGIRPTP